METGLLAAARYAQFICLMSLFGTALFPFYACAAGRSIILETIAPPMRRLQLWAAAGAGGSLLSWLAASVATVGDGFSSVADPDFLSVFFFATSFGGVWIFRLAAAFVLTLAVWLTRNRLFGRNGATAIAALLAGGLLASQAGTGHPASLPGPERLALSGAYALHVLGAAAWIGGLWPLAALLAHARENRVLTLSMTRVLRRFSRMAVIAVILVLIGGIANAAPRLTSFSALASVWFAVVLAKAALLAAMVAFGAQNRFVWTPLYAQRPKEANEALRRNVMIEQGLALVVLGLAAALGILSPP